MKIRARVNIDKALEAGLKKGAKIVVEEFVKALERSVLVVQGLAKQLAPVRTGTLRRSISRRVTGVKGVVGSNLKYAAIQEFGGTTGPHVIRPKNKKALFWPGATHPVKSVNHPGSKIKPKRYLRGALEQGISDIQKFFDQAAKAIVYRIFRRGG